MKIYLEEKIGDPRLFTGRKKDLSFFLDWIEGIKKRISMSTAILSRRKTGKTALLQRLYNLTFDKNNGVIPFYYEIREGQIWALDFCKDFFFTFLYQYIAFKSRKAEYQLYIRNQNFSTAVKIAKKEGLDYLVSSIQNVEAAVLQESVDSLWIIVRDLPRTLASQKEDFVVQMIDEFQYMNSEIYRDREGQIPMKDFAAGYMSTAEYKNAPLLISGSWVGWLNNLLMTMLPSRFRKYHLENIPEEEAMDMALNYSHRLNIPVTEQTAYQIAKISEGSPFYIGCLFQSYFPKKDFTVPENITEALEFEILSDQGVIKGTWMEYILTTFSEVNEINAKNIVLYLCKHRIRQVTRKELLDHLNHSMTDFELEQKLHALVKADIIEKGDTNFDYQGVRDNIFDKVFRGLYQKDIQEFDTGEIAREFQALLKEGEKKYRQVLGKYNRDKGIFTEVLFLNQIRFKAFHNSEFFVSLVSNLPEDFCFIDFEEVGGYSFSSPVTGGFQLDIVAKGPPGEYSLIGEVKNRIKKFSQKEAKEFHEKIQQLMSRERIEKPIGIVFSLPGFTKGAVDFFREHNIAWTKDKRWLNL